MEQEPHTQYSGTYFDKDAVLRMERWARVISWAILAGYLLDSIFTVYQTVSGAIIGNYPIDFSFTLTILLRLVQGAALFALLRLAGHVALVLLDIEDNTRRAARK